MTVEFNSSLWKFCGNHHDLVGGYRASVSQMTLHRCHCHNLSPSLWPHMTFTGFWPLPWPLRWVIRLNQELPTIPEYLSSTPILFIVAVLLIFIFLYLFTLNVLFFLYLYHWSGVCHSVLIFDYLFIMF